MDDVRTIGSLVQEKLKPLQLEATSDANFVKTVGQQKLTKCTNAKAPKTNIITYQEQ